MDGGLHKNWMLNFKQKKYLLFIVPLIGIVAFLFYRNTYTEFEPTVFEGNSYKKINANGVFYKNLEMVLDYNNVKYKIDDKGKILIKRSLSADKELLLNYTKKAFDTAWLNAHK